MARRATTRGSVGDSRCSVAVGSAVVSNGSGGACGDGLRDTTISAAGGDDPVTDSGEGRSSDATTGIVTLVSAIVVVVD